MSSIKEKYAREETMQQQTVVNISQMDVHASDFEKLVADITGKYAYSPVVSY